MFIKIFLAVHTVVMSNSTKPSFASLVMESEKPKPTSPVKLEERVDEYPMLTLSPKPTSKVTKKVDVQPLADHAKTTEVKQVTKKADIKQVTEVTQVVKEGKSRSVICESTDSISDIALIFKNIADTQDEIKQTESRRSKISAEYKQKLDSEDAKLRTAKEKLKSYTDCLAKCKSVIAELMTPSEPKAESQMELKVKPQVPKKIVKPKLVQPQQTIYKIVAVCRDNYGALNVDTLYNKLAESKINLANICEYERKHLHFTQYDKCCMRLNCSALHIFQRLPVCEHGEGCKQFQAFWNGYESNEKICAKLHKWPVSWCTYESEKDNKSCLNYYCKYDHRNRQPVCPEGRSCVHYIDRTGAIAQQHMKSLLHPR